MHEYPDPSGPAYPFVSMDEIESRRARRTARIDLAFALASVLFAGWVLFAVGVAVGLLLAR